MSRKLSKTQSLVAALVLFALMMGLQAAAQTYTIGAGSAEFGNSASGAVGDTQYTVSASTGTVTRDSGQGGRISTGSANATVTVSCNNQNACNTKSVNVKVGNVGSPTGRAKAIIGFNVDSGTATVSNVSGTNPITFTLTPIGKSSSKTFKLGMTFRVKGDESGVPTGAAATSYYVAVAAAPNTPASSGVNGSLTTTVFKSLSVVKNSDLSFGRIVRPRAGSGVATLNSNGTRSTSGGVFWLTTPFPVRASYSVTGENGKQLSISVDPFPMYRQEGDGTLTVTPLRSGSATPSLNAGGTYAFAVGGSIPLTDATDPGTYIGTFTTTVAYN